MADSLQILWFFYPSNFQLNYPDFLAGEHCLTNDNIDRSVTFMMLKQG